MVTGDPDEVIECEGRDRTYVIGANANYFFQLPADPDVYKRQIIISVILLAGVCWAADKPVSQLPATENIKNEDLFLVSQYNACLLYTSSNGLCS